MNFVRLGKIISLFGTKIVVRCPEKGEVRLTKVISY